MAYHVRIFLQETGQVLEPWVEYKTQWHKFDNKYKYLDWVLENAEKLLDKSSFEERQEEVRRVNAFQRLFGQKG